ncbi:MAG: bacterio-opsin activator domain-containing protein [Halanaeroarchaeum sp.]
MPPPRQEIYAETLAVFEGRADDYEPLTTPEVAAALDANRRTVYKRLRTLVDRGELSTKATGSNARVWWRPASDSTTPSPTGSESEPDREIAVDRDGDWLRPLFDAAPDGVIIHTVDGTILDVNETFVDMIGYPRSTLHLMTIFDFEVGFDEDVLAERLRGLSAGSMEHVEAVGVHERANGTTYPVEVWVSRVTVDAGPDQFVALVRDRTERAERERQLSETTRQLQAVLDTVEAAIFLKDRTGEYRQVNQNVRDILDIDEDEQIVGRRDAELFPADVATRYRADDERALESNRTIEIEERVPTSDGTRTYLTRKTPLRDDDGEPIGVCAVATDITAQKQTERELQRQREQLAALNEVNDVVRGITEAVIDGSTREQIERRICDHLVASDSYEFAWVSAVNSEMELERRVVAGDEGPPAEPPVVCHPEGMTGGEVMADAVEAGALSVSRIDDEDTDPSACREEALESGLRATATIPIVHEDTLFGVIGIASGRSSAFETAERRVLARLGEVVGHAIAAAERKRALLGDDVVELSFRMQGIERLGLPGFDSGRVVFDRIVPIGDGTYRQFGTATGETMATVRALAETDLTPHSGPVSVVDAAGEDTRFELRLREPEFLPTIVDAGGYIEEARIEDGKYTIRVHLPPSADVRRVVDVVTESYPATQMVSRRQTKRSNATPRQLADAVTERLTERQRSVIETAYAMGYFEVPRETAGDAVAASLGITTSTFHQHLRKAQRALFDELLTGGDR